MWLTLLLLVIMIIKKSVGGVFKTFVAAWNYFFFWSYNKNARGITRYRGAETADAFITSLPKNNCICVAGGGYRDSYVRAIFLTSLASQMKACGRSVLILHRGNDQLASRIRAIAGSSVISCANAVYDPFYGRRSDEVASMLSSQDAFNRYQLGQKCRNYLEGLALFYEDFLGKPLTLYSLISATEAGLGFAAVKGELDVAVRRGSFTWSKAERILRLMGPGQPDEGVLNVYLKDLQKALLGILCPPGKRGLNIVNASFGSGVCCMDLNNILYPELVYSLIASELEMCRNSCYFIFDEVPVYESERMRSILMNRAAGYAFCADSPISCLRSTVKREDLGFFTDFLDKMQREIIFQTPNSQAKILSDYYGTRELYDASFTFHGGQIGPGVHLHLVEKAMWRPELFTSMRPYSHIGFFQRSPCCDIKMIDRAGGMTSADIYVESKMLLG